MADPDVVIIGGGLAGSVAAIHLARGGAKVLLLERTRDAHDKVCGEFLSGEGEQELGLAGFALREAGAVPLRRVRIAGKRSLAGADLPFPAWSLSRRVLDEALLGLAEDAGAEVRRGVRVRSYSGHGSRWLVDAAGRPAVGTGAVFDATGKHDLKGHERRGVHASLVGLKCYASLTEEAARDLAPGVDVLAIPGGYLGAQMSEDGRANLCLVIERRALKRLGSAEAVFASLSGTSNHAARLLHGARFSGTPLGITRIPYGFVRMGSEGAFHLGDRAAVIPSFCGEGMSIALRSGRLAAETFLQGESADSFQSRFGKSLRDRVRLAARLSQLACSGLGSRAVPIAAASMPKLLPWIAAATRTPQTSSQSVEALRDA